MCALQWARHTLFTFLVKCIFLFAASLPTPEALQKPELQAIPWVKTEEEWHEVGENQQYIFVLHGAGLKWKRRANDDAAWRYRNSGEPDFTVCVWARSLKVGHGQKRPGCGLWMCWGRGSESTRTLAPGTCDL